MKHLKTHRKKNTYDRDKKNPNDKQFLRKDRNKKRKQRK